MSLCFFPYNFEDYVGILQKEDAHIHVQCFEQLTSCKGSFDAYHHHVVMIRPVLGSTNSTLSEISDAPGGKISDLSGWQKAARSGLCSRILVNIQICDFHDLV